MVLKGRDRGFGQCVDGVGADEAVDVFRVGEGGILGGCRGPQRFLRVRAVGGKAVPSRPGEAAAQPRCRAARPLPSASHSAGPGPCHISNGTRPTDQTLRFALGEYTSWCRRSPQSRTAAAPSTGPQPGHRDVRTAPTRSVMSLAVYVIGAGAHYGYRWIAPEEPTGRLIDAGDKSRSADRTVHRR